ncbi:MAG: tRNA lysidine(34) synthetase TilS [Rhodospirillales bacterium]|nr:tRNA lysidine(34) synthetase TilS [Rhodospirillales bacterium]
MKSTPPLGSTEFAQLMTCFGTFEIAPVVSVGVSGGADSLAFVILLDAWTRERGGRVIGLSVDHGLRAESGDEAIQTGKWLHAAGIEHHILPWIGQKPTTAIQAQARLARRELLLNWCRDAGILHLAMAHHGDDQAETYIMRLAKGSGTDGLAGMPMIKEFSQARIIRPLLTIEKNRLVATLQAMKQDWIEDPSNMMERFERVRVRNTLMSMNDAGASVQNIASAMADYGQTRAELDVVCASVLARCAQLHGAGFAHLNATALCGEGDVLGIRALGRLLLVIGGREYGAERDKLHRAYEALKSSNIKRGITLAGCRIIANKDGYLICRENRNLPGEVVINAGDAVYWDQRFRLKASVGGQSCVLAPLGENGWQGIAKQNPELKSSKVPVVARYSLPALHSNGVVTQVPHLDFDISKHYGSLLNLNEVAFSPREPVLGASFATV